MTVAAPPQRPPRRSPVRDIHPGHRVWGRVFDLLSFLWRFIWWVWTTIIFGGLIVGAIVAYLTSRNGSAGLSSCAHRGSFWLTSGRDGRDETPSAALRTGI